jgi:hypothetical protein
MADSTDPGMTIGGGTSNTVFGSRATIAGGQSNYVFADYAFVGGGTYDTVTGTCAVACGGYRNEASDSYSLVVGGRDNSARSLGAMVVGGSYNSADSSHAVVVGGGNNHARGDFAAVLAGEMHIALGKYSVIPGGYDCETRGDFSFAYGDFVYTTGDYNFAFGKGISSSTDNAVIFDTDVGTMKLGINTSAPSNALDVVGDIYCTGKVTSDGGYDPPYVLYDGETRQAIIERVANEVPHDKMSGAVLFWNREADRFEVYLPDRQEFRDLLGNRIEMMAADESVR